MEKSATRNILSELIELTEELEGCLKCVSFSILVHLESLKNWHSTVLIAYLISNSFA